MVIGANQFQVNFGEVGTIRTLDDRSDIQYTLRRRLAEAHPDTQVLIGAL